MLKRWCSIKEIEVYLLCEILISKDTLQGQKKLLRASLRFCLQGFNRLHFTFCLQALYALWGRGFTGNPSQD